MMKKFFAVLVVLAVLIPAAAWAGQRQRSVLISEKDLDRIEAFAKNVYDWRGKMWMIVDDDWPLYNFFTLEFRGQQRLQRIYFKVYPADAIISDRQVGYKELVAPGIKSTSLSKRYLMSRRGRHCDEGRRKRGSDGVQAKVWIPFLFSKYFKNLPSSVEEGLGEVL